VSCLKLKKLTFKENNGDRNLAWVLSNICMVPSLREVELFLTESLYHQLQDVLACFTGSSSPELQGDHNIPCVRSSIESAMSLTKLN
jgi:hypothetical protein